MHRAIKILERERENITIKLTRSVWKKIKEKEELEESIKDIAKVLSVLDLFQDLKQILK